MGKLEKSWLENPGISFKKLLLEIGFIEEMRTT